MNGPLRRSLDTTGFQVSMLMPSTNAGESEAWYTKPESSGNKVGEKIEDTLSPIGNATGPVFERGAGILGGAVDPLVGGIMRAGKGWGEQLGVGYGNAEGGPAKAQEAEHQRMKADLGGKEQTADNPLGL